MNNQVMNGKKNAIIISNLIPMLRTNPMETVCSMACHVVSNEIVVSISKTPSSSNALAVVPTPINKTHMFLFLIKFIKEHHD
ncbi:hypothetical protein Hanom_Chr16g01456671 [Helianthus anomalus]